MHMVVNTSSLPVYKKYRIASLLYASLKQQYSTVQAEMTVNHTTVQFKLKWEINSKPFYSTV